MGQKESDYRALGRWRDETFLDDLEKDVRIRPDKVAVITRRIGTGETHKITYAELSRFADRCAAAIGALGLQRGDTLAVHLDNRWEIAPLALGCLRAGVRICPLVPVYRHRELSTMLGLTEASALITMSEIGGDDLTSMITELLAELPTLKHVAVAGDRRPAGTLDFDEYFFGTPWEHTRIRADRATGAGRPISGAFHVRDHRRAERRAAQPEHPLRGCARGDRRVRSG
ncbi:AMP-binding protein [Fodinicola feengrottensis]|uniref:AMP-binding protein n=1 Tax=Fodinicola feengrottensis TaxID=435914 RepID=UPI0013D5F35A|nr:AMP-binding protein [Fodinicola feengrottensis]